MAKKIRSYRMPYYIQEKDEKGIWKNVPYMCYANYEKAVGRYFEMCSLDNRYNYTTNRKHAERYRVYDNLYNEVIADYTLLVEAKRFERKWTPEYAAVLRTAEKRMKRAA